MFLFVYNSFKRGERNHTTYGFDKAARFIGDVTAKGIMLTLMPDQYDPDAIDFWSGRANGELYELTDMEVYDKLAAHERLRGYRPYNFDLNGLNVAAFIASWDVIDERLTDADEGGILGEWLHEWHSPEFTPEVTTA